MSRKIGLWIVLAWGILSIGGCDRSPSGDAVRSTAVQALPPGSKYLLAAEPSGAKGVIQARDQAKDGEDVVIVGRVGGSREPLVKGRTAFTIVDPSYESCDERGETCDTPWDYCHADKQELARATAMIKFVDAQGKTIAHDVEEFLGVRPLQTVVVQGRAKRDDGNLTVLANGIFIRATPR